MTLLDTHVLVWWVNAPQKLSALALKQIERDKKERTLLVSAITIWEIALLVKKMRIELTMDLESWKATIERLPFLRFVPVDNTIAAKSVFLPGQFHDDPADRIIIATAREYGATLITSDKRFRSYPHVQSLW